MTSVYSAIKSYLPAVRLLLNSREFAIPHLQLSQIESYFINYKMVVKVAVALYLHCLKCFTCLAYQESISRGSMKVIMPASYQ